MFKTKKQRLQWSGLLQVEALMSYMDKNPEFANTKPVCGGTTMSREEQWENLSLKLNAMGPPLRSVDDWKKTWIGLRWPSGRSYGAPPKEEESLVKSPPRVGKAVGVITPTRQQQNVQCLHAAKEVTNQPRQQQQQPRNPLQPRSQQMPYSTHQANTSQPQQQQQRSQLNQKRQHGVIDDELPGCSSAKKSTSYQMSHICRQTRVTEEGNLIATEQANALFAEAAKRMVDAADIQAEAAKKCADAAIALSETFQRAVDLLLDLKRTQ